jgi:hypothetical protein
MPACFFFTILNEAASQLPSPSPSHPQRSPPRRQAIFHPRRKLLAPEPHHPYN